MTKRAKKPKPSPPPDPGSISPPMFRRVMSGAGQTIGIRHGADFMPPNLALDDIPAEPNRAELLTAVEHDVVERLGEIFTDLCGIAGDGPARAGDLAEIRGHIHALQHVVLKNAAARAYPDRYRLIGGHPAGTPESTAQITGGTQ